ncbi:MAG: ATP-binding protein [Planctomycetota bacterium]|nr:ATP-binding protein [Planctomycetota bacterium]
MTDDTGRDNRRTHSLLDGIRQRFAHEVYKDLQEFVYDTLKTSSVIYIRQDEDRVQPCFPRTQLRGFCSFCQKLREFSGGQGNDVICVRKEMDYICQGLKAEEHGEHWSWGWQRCHMGLLDFYMPIRSSIDTGHTPRGILAVLVVGHGRDPDAQTMRDILGRIADVTSGTDSREYFPDRAPSELSAFRHSLEHLAAGIPLLTSAERHTTEQALSAVLPLMEVIASRTLSRATFFAGEEFLRHFYVGTVGLDITEDVMWTSVERALTGLAEYAALDTAALYVGRSSDYTNLVRQAVYAKQTTRLAETFTLPSYDEFAWLTRNVPLTIPTRSGGLTWLSPEVGFGTRAATLFAKEMVGGHLVLLGFGHNRPIKAFQEALVYETVMSKIMSYIDTAMLRVELDTLMSETGHLMGRAWGKVAAGYSTLRRVQLSAVDSAQQPRVDMALWAMEDGVTRLELIRQNFYSFRTLTGALPTAEEQQHTSFAGEDMPEASSRLIRFDPAAVLDDVVPFFRRTLADTKLKPINYLRTTATALVSGRSEAKHCLKMVFLNLFDNAVKFAYDGTYLTIETRCEDNEWVAMFTNLGIGVAPDEQDRVFRPFVRSRFQNPIKRIEGLGLGLPYCKRIVDGVFHGHIVLNSREARTTSERRYDGDNWLTTVTVRLPVVGDAGGQ